MTEVSFSTLRLLEIRLKENSNSSKQLFGTTLALISIVMMCASFVAIEIAKAFPGLSDQGFPMGLAITPTLGLALLLFGAGIHFFALVHALFVTHNLRATGIIAIFFAFWALLGFGSVMGDHHSLVQVLAWIELGMMVLISQITSICFKKERPFWSILQIGLVGAIFLLWLPKAFAWIGGVVPDWYYIIPGTWILALGIWALGLLGQLLKRWMELQYIRVRLLKMLDSILWQNAKEHLPENIGNLG